MQIIKQIFCKHLWEKIEGREYFFKTRYSDGLYIKGFICKKCKKVEVISNCDWTLRDRIRAIKFEIKADLCK